MVAANIGKGVDSSRRDSAFQNNLIPNLQIEVCHFSSLMDRTACSGTSKIGGASTPDMTIVPNLFVGSLRRRAAVFWL